MTLDLTHLETLLAAATPGPWEIKKGDGYFTVRASDKMHLACNEEYYPEMFDLEDTEALVALRNAAPALIARVRELENPQIATVIDPDTGFTINGPEWLQLPLKARLIIQELSLQNDALKAEEEWQPIETAPENMDDIVLLAQAGHVYLGWWEDDVGWLQSDTCQSLNPTHWKHLPKPPTP